MSKVLALTHRPHKFDDVVGQGHIKPILRAMVQSGNMPPALIFGGSRGTGKTTCARVLAAALNCVGERKEGDACGECVQCKAVQQSNNDSVLEVDAASNGGVEEVRRIRDMCQYAYSAEWHVVLLDEAHSMSKEAFNALLKLLEEPPPQTVFVLLTTEVDRILDTVRSRSIMFEFRRIKHADIKDRLKYICDSEGIAVKEDLLDEIATRAQGGLRDAIMLLDQSRHISIESAEEFREQFGIRDYSVPMLYSALRGDYAEGYRLVAENFNRTGDAVSLVNDMSRLVADLLVIKSDGRPYSLDEDALKERVTLASATDTPALLRVVQVLWDLRERVRETENDQRASMELGFALIAAALAGQKAKSEPSRPILVTPESETMTLADMQREVGASP